MTWHPLEELIKLQRTTHKAGQRNKTLQVPQQHETRILHVDMDAFFAAIEQRDNPHLKGKPVIVGGAAGARGVVSTCSYEARQFGVCSGMGLTEAGRRCPHGVYLKTNGKKYTSTAIKIVEIFHKYTPIVEPVSIDEAYLDISNMQNNFENEVQLAKMLKQEIVDSLELTCTVGIAWNRIMAKLASGLQKPDGLTVLHKKEIASQVFPISVGKLWGIGEKTESVLNSIGIYTIGDLAVHPVNRLKKCFGVNGEHLKKVAMGDSAASVVPIDKRIDEKSIGHEHTFQHDMSTPDMPLRMLLKLSQKVGRRMRKRGFGGKTVTLKLRYADFETHTHRETFPELIWDDQEIYIAGKMLFHHLYNNKRAVRLLGISVSKLVPLVESEGMYEHQHDLFENSFRKSDVLPVMDILRDKFGEKIISRCGGQV